MKKALAVVCAFLVIATAGCTSPIGAGRHVPSKREAHTTAPVESGQATNKKLVFTAHTVAVPQQIGNVSPAGGYSTKFIGCNLTIANTGDTSQTVYTVAASLVDQIGANSSIMIPPPANASITVLPQKMILPPKQSAEGTLIFQVPSSGAYVWVMLKYTYASQEGGGPDEVDIPLG